ncbi:MAG: hypothetical protein ACLFTG_00230 [Alphaproteobacteria bacterium]
MRDLDLLDAAPFVDVVPEAVHMDVENGLITAALMTATAFRMKDMEGLLLALRTLAAAVDRFERARDLL